MRTYSFSQLFVDDSFLASLKQVSNASLAFNHVDDTHCVCCNCVDE